MPIRSNAIFRAGACPSALSRPDIDLLANSAVETLCLEFVQRIAGAIQSMGELPRQPLVERGMLHVYHDRADLRFADSIGYKKRLLQRGQVPGRDIPRTVGQ